MEGDTFIRKEGVAAEHLLGVNEKTPVDIASVRNLVIMTQKYWSLYQDHSEAD
jgi:hypothetical protein